MELMGYKVRDKLTGFTGVATSYNEFLSGTIQYSVYPKSEDGSKMADGWNLDVQVIEKVDDVRVAEPTTPDDSVIIQLGDLVQDITTNSTGTATRKITFFNGCVHFEVTERMNGKGDVKIWTTDHKRLKVIEAQHFQKTAEAAKLPPPKATGGPMSRASR